MWVYQTINRAIILANESISVRFFQIKDGGEAPHRVTGNFAAYLVFPLRTVPMVILVCFRLQTIDIVELKHVQEIVNLSVSISTLQQILKFNALLKQVHLRTTAQVKAINYALIERTDASQRKWEVDDYRRRFPKSMYFKLIHNSDAANADHHHHYHPWRMSWDVKNGTFSSTRRQMIRVHLQCVWKISTQTVFAGRQRGKNQCTVLSVWYPGAEADKKNDDETHSKNWLWPMSTWYSLAARNLLHSSFWVNTRHKITWFQYKAKMKKSPDQIANYIHAFHGLPVPCTPDGGQLTLHPSCEFDW